MSKTVFAQDFFLQNLKKHRSDVIGVIIFLENTFLLQPFFKFVQIHGTFMFPYIKENDSKLGSIKFQKF